jgi:hypothetical protein
MEAAHTDDSFELFEAFCTAAGIETGPERLALFLELPDARQTQMWKALATRVNQEREAEMLDGGRREGAIGET